MSRSPTLAALLENVIQSRLASIHTAMPAKVVRYYPDTQTADVQPVLNNIEPDADGGVISETLPQIPSVPVAFPRGGGGFVSFPMQVGDPVWLIFGERSIDSWMAKSQEGDPGVARYFDLSDAVAYPGAYPQQKNLVNADAANIVIGFDDGRQIHIEPGSGNIQIGKKAADDFVALAQKVLTELTKIQTSMNTHVHPTGVGPSGVATVPYTPASVAATKTKAD